MAQIRKVQGTPAFSPLPLPYPMLLLLLPLLLLPAPFEDSLARGRI